MNPIERYISIQKAAEAELSFKKSRFIACLLPVQTEPDFQRALERVRERWPKATHYCYAVITEGGRYEKMSDDGEPSGTAGRPILDVLRGSGLINAALIVVRYFGGTLLGTGGLVRAYSDTAKEVLKTAERVSMTPAAELKVRLDYSYYNQFESKCRAKLIGETEIQFLEQVEILLHVPLEEKDALTALLKQITARTVQIEERENQLIPLPL